MATATAETYSKNQVRAAGKLLREWRAALMSRDDIARFEYKKVTKAFQVVEWWRGLHARPLARVNANLRYYVRQAAPEVEPEVTQRLKRLGTIIHKLDREPTMRLTSMEDIGGVRAILPTQRQVLDVVAALDRQDRWTIRRHRFYIDGGNPGPKKDGYRAVHLTVAKDRCYVEIQLRTPGQDAWAQSVEQDTRRLRADLKFGAGPADLREYYVMVSELLWMREQSIEPEVTFMNELSKLYAATRSYFPAPSP